MIIIVYETSRENTFKKFNIMKNSKVYKHKVSHIYHHTQQLSVFSVFYLIIY